jgi:ATP synthase protein I
VSVVVGTTIGFILDSWFDTKPVLIICFFVIGAIAGIWNVIKVAKKMQNKIKG